MSTATLTILPFRLISWIWTGPYEVLATFPLTAVSPAGRFLAIDPCGKAPGTTSVCPPPLDDADAAGEAPDDDDAPPPEPPAVAARGLDGTCDLNDSRATRPAMVPVTARITRRMVADPPQNSNDSKWMRCPGIPAARRARTAAEVMPDGPQT